MFDMVLNTLLNKKFKVYQQIFWAVLLGIFVYPEAMWLCCLKNKRRYRPEAATGVF